jgi:hypothetical protein
VKVGFSMVQKTVYFVWDVSADPRLHSLT